MTYAVVMAGGCGKRTGQSVPKQFLTVNDIPIVIHTLLNIQQVDCVDKILVVIPEGWEKFISSYVEQYQINKFDRCILGGETRHRTICNAIFYLKEQCTNDVIITLIDANRPMIPRVIIQESVEKLKKNSICIAGEPCFDTMFVAKNSFVDEIADRTVLFKGQTPETMWLGDAIDVYEKAEKDNIDDLATTTLFMKYGKQAEIIKGSAMSFKITTSEDIEIFKSMISR